ncbi:MAG: B12-binding domain-containing radical SAM protein [Desulfuromonadaceae bacterium]
MKILLATLHAKYSHASLALPCLAVYCRDIPETEITLREWTVNEPREHILRLVMAEGADLVAFSCYIWNIEQTLRIVSDIKKISPQTRIVLGGPEVSFAIFDLMHDNPAVDLVIKGEGEETFRALVTTLTQEHPGMLQESLAEIDNLFFRDGSDTLSGPLSRKNMELDSLPSPFAAGMVDFSKPLVYYETSRGCPFSCAFCLSATEGAVRSFGMERIKKDLLFLMEHRVAQIKLVDRTFNYDAGRADAIWEFILEHNRSSHFHFEIAADLLTDNNLEVLGRVPPNTFRFEIGVQSASQRVLEQVKRSADLQRIFVNVRRLRGETEVELHLDLIAGLPGEGYDGFLQSLQTVAELQPDDIQLEPLKLLKGAPMREIARREGYFFSESPPYTILRNPWLSYAEVCLVETIGRLLDLFNKHGGFATSFRLLERDRPFSAILDLMARQAGNENLSSLSCRRVFELFARLAEPLADRAAMHDALLFDYCRSEMPLMGKLPSFAVEQQGNCSWPTLRDLPSSLEVPRDSRVKSFRYEFMSDYRTGENSGGATTLTFVYISGAGRGLQVLII